MQFLRTSIAHRSIGQPDGTIAITVSDLARYWGWNPSTTSRRVQGMGRIWSAPAHARPGRSFRIHSENTRCATGVRRRGQPHFPVSEISRHSNGEPACAIRCTGRRHLDQDRAALGSPIVAVRVTRTAGGAALAARGGGGLVRNPDQGLVWRHVGRTPEASTLLSGLSVSADVLALILPTATRTLWTDRRRMAAAVAWALWTITIAVALMATVGFAALNIADTTAARARTVTARAALTARIERLRTERGGITESRSVAAIEAELQAPQPCGGRPLAVAM
jgi:hypothetical protein